MSVLLVVLLSVATGQQLQVPIFAFDGNTQLQFGFSALAAMETPGFPSSMVPEHEVPIGDRAAWADPTVKQLYHATFTEPGPATFTRLKRLLQVCEPMIACVLQPSNPKEYGARKREHPC